MLVIITAAQLSQYPYAALPLTLAPTLCGPLPAIAVGLGLRLVVGARPEDTFQCAALRFPSYVSAMMETPYAKSGKVKERV
jgi:hypothetical protein